jgi:Enhanced disease susceptibility 1 protein EP domain
VHIAVQAMWEAVSGVNDPNLTTMDITDKWMAIRRSCYAAESFWDRFFQRAENCHFPDKLIAVRGTGKGRHIVSMQNKWMFRAFRFRALVEPLAIANWANQHRKDNASYVQYRPGRYEMIDKFE